jgi:hypothetical protein
MMGWLKRIQKKRSDDNCSQGKQFIINSREQGNIIRIHQVSDYLKLIGMRINIFMLNKENIQWVTVSGIVRDLSDNGQSLVLADVEILWKDDRFSHQEICQVDLADFDMIKVDDRNPGK